MMARGKRISRVPIAQHLGVVVDTDKRADTPQLRLGIRDDILVVNANEPPAQTRLGAQGRLHVSLVGESCADQPAKLPRHAGERHADPSWIADNVNEAAGGEFSGQPGESQCVCRGLVASEGLSLRFGKGNEQGADEIRVGGHRDSTQNALDVMRVQPPGSKEWITLDDVPGQTHIVELIRPPEVIVNAMDEEALIGYRNPGVRSQHVPK